MQYLSELTTQASGSAGGVTASHNQHMRYLRARTKPTDPATPHQINVRAKFRTLCAFWLHALSTRTRDRWHDYAAHMPLTNALGDPTYLTGRHHYIRLNMARHWIRPALPLIDLPPTVYTLPAIGNVSFGWGGIPAKILVYFDNAQGWASEIGGYLALYQSPPKSRTINFYKAPWRWCNEIAGNPFIPPTSPQSLSSRYPHAPNSRLFFMYRVLRADGNASNTFLGQTNV